VPSGSAQGEPFDVIDLHLHTTASDGRCTPLELVDRAAEAGVTVMAVTDHDTTAAVADVKAAAHARGIVAISGIEITAVESGRDVHILGYFLDPHHPQLAGFLARQREQRVSRVKATGDRLAELGVPIDVVPIVTRAREDGGRSIGRPQVARAMVAAGHVADTQEAFDRWLAEGRPGFVPRAGVPPEEVMAILHRAGGLASLAHPGQTAVDSRIAAYCVAGLDAIEAYHPDHDAATTARYLSLASRFSVLTTGGSDFHGDPGHGFEPGSVTLPEDAWLRLRAAAPRA
jgi:predicted metal-dependent phosphoesterase TrpH